LQDRDDRGKVEELIEELDLDAVLERDVRQLSGGELQRFAIAVVAVQDADMYMFDEPSSYLDVKQRLKASRVIRSLLHIEKYVIVVEHDLSVLDYLSDFICCLYGKPGAYGVVTMPFGVREGINIFLAGFVPTENLR
jgi:ATP-binding cassette subfamily E protein 1